MVSVLAGVGLVFNTLPLTSYFLWWLVLYAWALLHGTDAELIFVQVLEGVEDARIRWSEIVGATVVAVPLSFGVAFAINHYLTFRLGRFMGITKKHGQMDVWHAAMADPALDSWAIVRDHVNDTMYFGWLQAWTEEAGGLTELYLLNVEAYVNATGEHTYDAPALYLRNESKNWMVQFVKRSESESEREYHG